MNTLKKGLSRISFLFIIKALDDYPRPSFFKKKPDVKAEAISSRNKKFYCKFRRENGIFKVRCKNKASEALKFSKLLRFSPQLLLGVFSSLTLLTVYTIRRSFSFDVLRS